jgi:prepilin-type N-terminal cleavage/methylation domain-containing protein
MRRAAGFTMLELMMVVAIVGILAVVAVVSYTKVMRKANASEIPEMFGELKSREEAYKAEFGIYLPLCWSKTSTTSDGKDCNETTDDDYWPRPLPGKGQRMDANPMPARWAALRVHIGKGLFCQYKVIAGLANEMSAMGPTGKSMFSATVAPGRSWYYLMAQCDWDGNTSVNALFWQRDDLAGIGSQNELR